MEFVFGVVIIQWESIAEEAEVVAHVCDVTYKELLPAVGCISVWPLETDARLEVPYVSCDDQASNTMHGALDVCMHLVAHRR